MNPEIAIKVTNLSKHYAIGKQKDDSLRGALASLFAMGKKKTENFKALDGIDFEINKGDVVGIIGKNGAGKSTLLKILSQITQPTTGRIEINGRIASLLEVGTGFHPELTGRENIYLNGTILGMTRSEVKSKFDEIVEFSGVEKFIDTPVKHYSSGMYVRLAFAVAAHLEPEILIIDEVLAVGDAEFQKKCLGKMDEVAKTGRTVLFVSHNISSVKDLCTKGLLLKNGELIERGPVDKIIASYLKSSDVQFEVNQNKEIIFKDTKSTSGHFGIQRVLTNNQTDTFTFFTGDDLSFKFHVFLDFVPRNLTFGIVIKNNDLTPIIGINNKHLGVTLNAENKKEFWINVNIPKFPYYNDSNYFVDLFLDENDDNIDVIFNAFSFELKSRNIYINASIPDSKINQILIPNFEIIVN